jgi:hypothetical protein
MALDNIAGIKSISVPTWLKLLIFGIVVTVLIADLTLVWSAATNPKHKDWFSVAVQLLGSLVPMLLVILLLAFATRGPEAIYRKTSYLLLHVIPATIASSLTWSSEFEALEKAQRKKSRSTNMRIEVAHRPGDFCCIYRIWVPQLYSNPPKTHLIFLVVELKARQANMHLCVQAEAFARFCEKSGLKGFDAFKKAFDSTVHGAKQAGCHMNQAVFQWPYSQDMPLTVVVVHRELSEDFFTDPSEQIFWVQDMVTMLKGFMEEGLDHEQPVEWFPEVSDGKSQPAIAI